MTAGRALVVLGAFTLIALAVVFLRIEQAGSAARAMAAERRWIELRRDLWAVEANVSRLRAPGRIHDRVGWFRVGLQPPGSLDPSGDASPFVLGSSHR